MNSPRVIIALLMVTTFLLIAGSSIAGAQEKDAVIIVADRIGWSDWRYSAGPNTARMLRESAIALANNRSAREFEPSSVYLTLGAGERAGLSGSAELAAGLAYSSDEIIENIDAATVFERNTGRTPQAGSGLHLAIPSINDQSAKYDYGAVPGLLGETLKSAGKKVALLGNADTDKPEHRETFLIGMDAAGQIPIVQLDDRLMKPDKLAPFGRVIDTGIMNEKLKSVLDKADLTVIDFGDTARTEDARAFLTPEVLERDRASAVKRLDAVIAKLRELGKKRELLIVLVTPVASFRDAKEGRKLTPLAIYDSRAFVRETSLLWSSSTRRAGIVVGTDIAPTILKFFEISVPPEMSGQPLVSSAKQGSIGNLMYLEQRIAEASLARPTILTAYITALIILLIIILLMIIFSWRIKPRVTAWLRFVIRWLMLIPVTLLAAGALPHPSTFATLVTVIPISLLIAGMITPNKSERIEGVAGIVGITLAAIIIDITCGQVFSQSSVLGYDPIIGARFYGVGNELMGYTVGSAVIGAAIILETWQSGSRHLFWTLMFLLACIAALIGMPGVGANFGGLITAAVTFTIAGFKFRGVRFTAGQIAITGGIIIMAVTAVIGWDTVFSAKASHIGKAASGGAGEIWLTIQRKVATNYRLLQWTAWSRMFLLSLAVYAMMFIKPVGAMREFADKHKTLSAGIVSVVFGSIIAMAVNDSGVVAGATTIIFAVLTLLYVIIEKYESGWPEVLGEEK